MLGRALRFATVVTDEDFANLANDLKTPLARQYDHVNTTLKPTKDQAKTELEGRLQQLAGQYGLPLMQGIRGKFAKILRELTYNLKQNASNVDQALSANECKPAIFDRVEQKWLSLCRQAAAEIEASALDPAKKKTFLATVMEGNVDVAHVKIALRLMPAFDAKELAATAKAGNPKKLAEQFHLFVTKTHGAVTARDEFHAVNKGAGECMAFIDTISQPLFVQSWKAPTASPPPPETSCSPPPRRHRPPSRANSGTTIGKDSTMRRSWTWPSKRSTGRTPPSAPGISGRPSASQARA